MESITITQVNIHEFKALIERAVHDALNSHLSEAKSPSGDDLLTVQQAAELLHLSVPTIYGLLHRRELPSMKRGKRVYFRRSQLLDYVEQGRRLSISEIESKPKTKYQSPKKTNKYESKNH